MSGSTAKTEEQSRSKFPSPRGDKLCLSTPTRFSWTNMFPSPRGDKLCHVEALSAAISALFPSPRGDKLCLLSCWHCIKPTLFPSPRGDKLCPKLPAWAMPGCGFPSPRGDKLCPWKCICSWRITGFRPLAGISCVCKTAQLEPVGLGLVLTGSLYHTPLQPASGSWK